MTQRRPYIIATAVVFAVVAWYLFRPELLFVDRRANDAPPILSSVVSPSSGAAAASAASPMIVASGSFRSGAHPTAGRVSIQRVADGRRVLRLEGFSTSNGPDVRVYLVAADSIDSGRTVKRAEFVDLGALKGNVGDQNYELPASLDLAKYRAVSIWCRRFSVNFGSAVLRETGS